MSLGLYDYERRRRRRVFGRFLRYGFYLGLIGVAAVFAYQTGIEQMEGREARLAEQIDTLSTTIERLERDRAEWQTTASDSDRRYRDLAARFEREVPRGQRRVLASLVSDRLDEGVDAERLAFYILIVVGATLALGMALDRTGGAAFLATALVQSVAGGDPVFTLGLLFLIVAIATNLLSNNACAVLFTPIAVNLAWDLGLPPSIMAITVLLAANCSFATPIGYQTNLLVMGPGHYRFVDFLRGGLPLVIIVWLTFCLFGPAYFGL